MSRRQEVCRDFQRGNCRFGARCKFLHQVPQGRQQFGGGGADQSTQPAPDHKCTDPRACKERIKEDFTHERPTFWRLTCYAHWRHLPNDIAGDTSFEELRAVAYENAKQGISLRDLAQREAMMFRAKEAEFDALLRNPYRGPGNQTFSSQAAALQPPPFGDSGAETRTIFGKPVPANSFVSQIFGPASGGLAGGFGNGPSPPAPAFNSPAPFNSQFFSPSALNSQSLLTNPQTPFNSTPFSNPFNPTPSISALNQQTPFNSTPFSNPFNPTPPISALSQQSPFNSTPPMSALNQQSPFNSPASNPQSPFNFTPPSTLNQKSPFVSPSYPPSTFQSSNPNILSGQTAAANIGSGATFAPPATNPEPSLPAVSKPEVDKIWLAEAWELGQIPEDEPPLAVR